MRMLFFASEQSVHQSNISSVIYTVLVPSIVAISAVLLTQRLTRSRELLRDNQTRMANLIVETFGTAYQFRMAFTDFCFHAPRGGGRFGPAGSDPSTWEEISKEEAAEHDNAAAEAIEKMTHLQEEIYHQLGVLSVYAPTKVVSSLESVVEAFIEMMMTSSSEKFEGARAQAAEESMEHHYKAAIQEIRKVLDIRW